MIYEDVVVDSTHAFGSHTFTAEEIRRFAAAYDPQSFHLDPEAAKESFLGGLCASGWHTASVMMGLATRHFAREAEPARIAGRPVPALGPSPGFDNLKWLKPVFAGDTITYVGRIAAKRESVSRPAWGLVSLETSGTNQNDERVFMVTGHFFAARRHAG